MTDGNERAGPIRPRTRGECAGSPRPCPWAGCRYHLLLDLLGSSIQLNLTVPSGRGSRTISGRQGGTMRGWLEVEALIDRAVDHLDDMEATCALDVADLGAQPLRVVGRLLGVTKERARQIEELALTTMRRRPP